MSAAKNIHATAWMDLKCIQLSERSQTQNPSDYRSPFLKYSGKGKSGRQKIEHWLTKSRERG